MKRGEGVERIVNYKRFYSGKLSAHEYGSEKKGYGKNSSVAVEIMVTGWN